MRLIDHKINGDSLTILKKKNKIRIKILLMRVLALLAINLLVIVFVLQLSSVQTYLGRFLAKNVSQKIGFEIKIGKVDIVWLDRLKLEDVEITDLSSTKMISVVNVMVDYNIISLMGDRTIELDKVILDRPVVNLNLNDSVALNITDFISTIRRAYLSKKNKRPKTFSIKTIEIINGQFSYDHLGRTALKERFDFNHFGFDSIYSHANNLVIIADTFKLTIEKLKSKETSSQLAIKSLRVDFQMTKSNMKFNDLATEIGNSIINDSIIFNYNHVTDLNNFVDNVLINAHFRQLKLSTQDLKYFTPYFNSINDTILFSGNFNGHINDFITTNFTLHFGSRSTLKGSAYFEGLPDVLNTFIDLKFKESQVYKNDLSIFIPSKTFKKYYPIDSANINGSFTGYPKDFVANATFKTSIGFARTDINLKLDENPAKSKYSGSIKLVDFDLGQLVGSYSFLGRVSLVGKIKGTGITTQSADFILESKIDKIHFNDYDYQSIKTNAHFSQGLFDGSLTINDPNIILNAVGIIDFRGNRNKIVLKGELVKAQLNKLHIRKDSSDISVKFDINITGSSLDSIVGKINFSDIHAHNNEYTYLSDHLEIISEIKNKNRFLTLKSDRVDLKIEGDFNFTSAFKDFQSIWLENKINFLNQKNDIESFYQSTIRPSSSSNLSFDVKLININPLINLFNPKLHLSGNTRLNGTLNTTSLKEFTITFSNDTIIYDHNYLINNNIQLISKSNFQTKDISVDFYFRSQHQMLKNKSSLDSLSIKIQWQRDSLEFNLQIQQGVQKNINKITALLLFKNDTTILSILKSRIQVLGQSWNFHKNNQVTFTKDQVFFSNMSIVSGSQELFTSGSISRSTNTPITIIATNIGMNNLNPLVSNELEGVLNGSVQISNIFDTPLIESKIRIDSFKVDGYNFGNIVGRSNWNPAKELFDINFFVERSKIKLVNVTGTYKPLGDEHALNLKAKLIDTDLQLIAPFTKRVFSDINGYVSGNILITGPLFKPRLNGTGTILDASFTVDYLKSTFNIEGKWHMNSTSFSFSNIKITDNNIGVGSLEAIFQHSNFKDFKMNLKASFKNLTVLNTVSKDNNYFYGTAIGSGNLSITGPFSNIVITTTAKTEKGTKFYIPLSSNKGGVKQEDFIAFSNFTTNVNDTLSPLNEEVNLKNISVKLDIEITPEAYAEIIFDLTAGDIIRGRGKGNISLAVDTKGEFTVLGDYEFTEGAYNFTMYNIINKEFKINPKSKISWSGDPYLGKMDINAAYKVNTSIAPIIDIAYKDLPEIQRIYPSKVILDLNGPLLSPGIDFDIIIEDYPRSNVNIDTEVRAFLNKIHNDEQEMNRQVFSLLVFRKYSPPNSFSTGGTVGSSVSEFVSNQLSYWISQVDDNLTIDFDFDLSEIEENALETFQLSVSYAFMDGKLIVTRDGGFTDQNQQTTLSSITGDWTVEYLISEDGKLRIKIFKRTNYDQLSSSNNTNDELITGGFSLLYTSSFESIKELFTKNKNKQSSDGYEGLNPKEAIKPEDELHIP